MKTIENPISNEIIIEKSRFITYLCRVEAIEECQSIIQSTKKKHWDANHCCYALIIGENSDTMRSNDDGEPSGTAGIPILEVLKKNDVSNILCLVVRYFGGVKLGTGGLIRAYTQSAVLALKNSTIIQNVVLKKYQMTIAYGLYSKIIETIKSYGYLIETKFEADVVIVFAIKNIEETFVTKIENIINSHLNLEYLGDIQMDVSA